MWLYELATFHMNWRKGRDRERDEGHDITYNKEKLDGSLREDKC